MSALSQSTNRADGVSPLARLWRRRRAVPARAVRMPIATKLTLSYLLIIVLGVVAFSGVGTQLLRRLVLAEAQTAIRNDLNTAREILHGQLSDINDIVRLTADRFIVKDALLGGQIEQAAAELGRVAKAERLDFLTVTDGSGVVLLRTSNPGVSGDSRSHDPLIAAASSRKVPVAAPAIMSADDLRRESPPLAGRAYIRFVETPRARARAETEETAGMVLAAAAPILDYRSGLIGFLYGGVLLNQTDEIVDKVKRTAFQGVRRNGKEVGTATIFQDDVRISTNVLNADGTRAVGTRVAADVYARVAEGKPWVGRAFVVNDWYLTAYEPIRDLRERIIGILYVGVPEQRYIDIARRTIDAFLVTAFIGGLLATVLGYYISRRLSAGLAPLAAAAREMAQGQLGARVAVRTGDELEDLADAFNTMAASLQARDEQLRAYAHTKIRESERLAFTGQLAAGVAHELNNPLQGIVAYAHMLLEKVPADSPLRSSLEKIATQADRSREIIRGLLDFARPRPPQVRPANVNVILQECIALVENQATFHNIRIAWDLAPTLPAATVDPSQIQQVFMNMIVNAAEAMDGAGTLTLTTRAVADPPGVEIAIGDTGHGIKPEDRDRLFDPFFTTKPPGHGVGLGLAISYGIIREHRGTISVESAVGRGTTFTIRLPLGASGA